MKRFFSSIRFANRGSARRATATARACRNPAVRLSAAVGAMSLVALGAGIGTGAAAQTPADAPLVDAAVAPIAAGAAASGDGLNVTVGKTVSVTTDPSGSPVAKKLYSTTRISGAGNANVEVPIGTNKPVDLTSFERLQVQNDSIVYNVSNSGNQVQEFVASGGDYQGQFPVTFALDLKVNGKSVDPNTATSITGDVELNYNFTNHTSRIQTITYKDAFGKLQSKDANVAIPFNVDFDSTYGKGWADISAPWANGGFSTGEEVTGSISLSPSLFNNQNPNGTAKVTAKAYNAALPAANVTVTPKSSMGLVTSIGKVVEEYGPKAEQLLTDKALPLLLKVQEGMGTASGEISTFLDDKVDPIVAMLSKLHLNPATANDEIRSGGKEVAGVGDVLLGVNEATEDAADLLAEALDSLTSAKSQAALAAVIADLDELRPVLELAIGLLPTITGYLKEGATYLAMDVPSALEKMLCPGGKGPCTFGDVVEDQLVDKLDTTCTTAVATNDKWGDALIQSALDTAIGNASGDTKKGLQDLKTNLIAQKAAGIPADCVSAAKGMETTLSGLLSNLGALGGDLDDLIPLLKSLDSGINDVEAGLKQLQNAMPAINKALDNPCRARTIHDDLSSCGLIQVMRIVAKANASAAVQLNEGIVELINDILPIMDKLFGIANDVGRAAGPLGAKVDELPGLIDQLAFGTIGTFVGDVEGLAGLADKLTSIAGQLVETNKVVDARFHSGEAFPYGSASGGGAATAAVYSYTVLPAKPVGASVPATAAFALVLLLVGGALALAMQLRKRTR